MKPTSRFLAWMLGVLILPLAVSAPAARCQSLPLVTPTAVKVDTDSFKVDYLPYPGAQDYGVWEVTTPTDIKFAGMWHLDADQNSWPFSNMQFNVDANGNPIYPLSVVSDGIPMWSGTYGSWWSAYHHIDIPALEIEENGVTPGVPHTYIIAAFDSLGPIPYLGLYGQTNNLLFPPVAGANPMLMNGMNAFGSNMGDAYWMDLAGVSGMVTNGQGNYQNHPNIIAESQPFTVTTQNTPALPSASSATGVFFDTFTGSQGVFSPPANVNVVTGTQTQTLTDPAGQWTILSTQLDLRDSSVFLHGDHLMDVTVSGGDPRSNNALNVQYGTMAFEPSLTLDLSGGKIGHVTFEVDTHTNTRRWRGLWLALHGDTVTNFNTTDNEPVNQSDQALAFEWEANEIIGNEYAGSPSPMTFIGSNGLGPFYRPFASYQYGHGLDNRTRFDLFTQTVGGKTQYALFEDGAEEADGILPSPLGFSQADVYFTDYAYHLSYGQQELESQAPYETFWIDPNNNGFPYSFEGHWDNMGFESLPASTPWSSIGSLIEMPQPQAPVFTSVTPPPMAPTLTGLAGVGQVALSWSAPAGAAAYNLYRATASGSETLYQPGLTSTTYTDTAVTGSPTYYYEVTAVNAGGESGRSNEVAATPLLGLATATGKFTTFSGTDKPVVDYHFKPTVGAAIDLTQLTPPLAAQATQDCIDGQTVTITYQGNALLSIQ